MSSSHPSPRPYFLRLVGGVPLRCHIDAVITATMSHCCGCRDGPDHAPAPRAADGTPVPRQNSPPRHRACGQLPGGAAVLRRAVLLPAHPHADRTGADRPVLGGVREGSAGDTPGRDVPIARTAASSSGRVTVRPGLRPGGIRCRSACLPRPGAPPHEPLPPGKIHEASPANGGGTRMKTICSSCGERDRHKSGLVRSRSRR